MKVISVSIMDSENSGCFGSYHRVGKDMGIKVLEGCFETEADAKNSCNWQDAQEEAYAMRRAQKSGIAPKCYGVYVVRNSDSAEGNYYVGILMQHLGQNLLGHRMDKGIVSGMRQEDIQDEIRKKLLKVGVEHGDLHRENVIYFKRKYYALDFGPNAVCTFKVRTPVKKITKKSSKRSRKSNRLRAA